jgi:hypothetical protein
VARLYKSTVARTGECVELTFPFTSMRRCLLRISFALVRFGMTGGCWSVIGVREEERKPCAGAGVKLATYSSLHSK